LPKTAFQVDVVVTKTTNIKGIYADFAEKLLGITNFCKENRATFQLKNITVTPFAVPDEKLQFVAELSPEQIKNNFLQSVHTKNRTAGFSAFYALDQRAADILPDFFINFADVLTQQTHETYTETKIINGVVTQVPVTQTKVTTKTLAQQAQAAADLIEKIRDDRYAILSFAQETSLSKDAFEYLVNQLNELEKQYLELFSGAATTEDISERLIVFPNSDYDLTPLFSIAPNEGFSASTSKTNAYNYYLKCNPQVQSDYKESFSKMFPVNTSKKIAGYSIRKAAPTLLSLVHGNVEETIFGVFPVYQYGLLETLPANLDAFEIDKWSYIY
jgi:hypothetical protein